MKQTYDAPTLRRLGTVTELTRGGFDKVGSAHDQYTDATGGALDGSIIPD